MTEPTLVLPPAPEGLPEPPAAPEAPEAPVTPPAHGNGPTVIVRPERPRGPASSPLARGA